MFSSYVPRVSPERIENKDDQALTKDMCDRSQKVHDSTEELHTLRPKPIEALVKKSKLGRIGRLRDIGSPQEHSDNNTTNLSQKPRGSTSILPDQKPLPEKSTRKGHIGVIGGKKKSSRLEEPVVPVKRESSPAPNLTGTQAAMEEPLGMLNISQGPDNADEPDEHQADKRRDQLKRELEDKKRRPKPKKRKF
jgi:hypothetical protein